MQGGMAEKSCRPALIILKQSFVYMQKSEKIEYYREKVEKSMERKIK